MAKANELDKIIGANLYRLRQGKMTVIQLSKILGVTRQNVYNMESGKTKIAVSTLIELSKILDSKVTDFMEGLPKMSN